MQTIRIEKSPDRIGIITLNRPEKRNAISILMRQELSTCLADWRDDGDIGVLIVTGDGKACAGFDLDEFKLPERFVDFLNRHPATTVISGIFLNQLSRR